MMTMEQIRALLKVSLTGRLTPDEVDVVMLSILVIRDNAYEQGREDAMQEEPAIPGTEI